MQCPKCRTPLFVVEYEGVELDRCPDCDGTWFDSGELALLFAADAAAAPDPASASDPWVASERIAALPDATTDEKPRKCPSCDTKMRKVNIGPSRRVLVDACRNGHGLWFDDDEVAALARDLETLADELPRRVVAFLGESLGGQDRRRKDDEA
jgi:Zn-finger nucleic acid-binding protein